MRLDTFLICWGIWIIRKKLKLLNRVTEITCREIRRLATDPSCRCFGSHLFKPNLDGFLNAFESFLTQHNISGDISLWMNYFLAARLNRLSSSLSRGRKSHWKCLFWTLKVHRIVSRRSTEIFCRSMFQHVAKRSFLFGPTIAALTNGVLMKVKLKPLENDLPGIEHEFNSIRQSCVINFMINGVRLTSCTQGRRKNSFTEPTEPNNDSIFAQRLIPFNVRLIRLWAQALLCFLFF